MSFSSFLLLCGRCFHCTFDCPCCPRVSEGAKSFPFGSQSVSVTMFSSKCFINSASLLFFENASTDASHDIKGFSCGQQSFCLNYTFVPPGRIVIGGDCYSFALPLLYGLAFFIFHTRHGGIIYATIPYTELGVLGP